MNDLALPFTFTDATIETREGSRSALVFAPTRRLSMGRERIGALGQSETIGPMDRTLIDAVGARATPPSVVIFRGISADGCGSWGFAEDLSPEECHEMGRRLARAQIPVYRRMLHRGMTLMVHVDWGPRECEAVRRGLVARADELEQEQRAAGSDDPDRVIRRVDHWIARNLNFYFTSRYQRVVERLLPDQLPMFEKRHTRLRSMLDDLPAHAVD